MRDLITKSFRDQAVAFPDAVDRALAKMETVDQAKDMLDRASAMKVYAERLKAGIEIERPIAIGVLKIKAKIGELLPRGKVGAGRGNKNSSPDEPFSYPAKEAKAAYRKLADNRSLLEEYVKSIDDVPSQSGFLKVVTEHSRKQRESQREQKRAANSRKVRKARRLEDTGTFSTLVVDPPWDWGDEGDVNQLGRAKPDYATLSLPQLTELPLKRVADANSHLYLWITNRSLPKGFGLLECWGFRYVTCLTWCKPSFGMGNYFRGSTEQILFGVRGSQALKRKDVGTWFSWPRPGKKHSSKPDGFYELVESCSPGPYIDIFSRRERKGWVSWGESSVG